MCALGTWCALCALCKSITRKLSALRESTRAVHSGVIAVCTMRAMCGVRDTRGVCTTRGRRDERGVCTTRGRRDERGVCTTRGRHDERGVCTTRGGHDERGVHVVCRPL